MGVNSINYYTGFLIGARNLCLKRTVSNRVNFGCANLFTSVQHSPRVHDAVVRGPQPYRDRLEAARP